MKPYEPKNIADYSIKNVCENIKGNDSLNSMIIENNIQELKKEKDIKNEKSGPLKKEIKKKLRKAKNKIMIITKMKINLKNSKNLFVIMKYILKKIYY